jgi:hypothetical protein
MEPNRNRSEKIRNKDYAETASEIARTGIGMAKRKKARSLDHRINPQNQNRSYRGAPSIDLPATDQIITSPRQTGFRFISDRVLSQKTCI